MEIFECKGIYKMSVNEGFTRDLEGKDGVEVVTVRSEVVGQPIGVPRDQLPLPRPRLFRLRWTLLFNIPMTIIFIAFIILSEYGYIPHNNGGFYCGDPAISHKFQGDTISIKTLLTGTAFIPLFVISITELLLYRPESISFSNKGFVSAFKNTYIWYGEYLLSFFFNLIFMDVVKFIIGEPRPHFLDTCRPDTAINCTVGTYISEYKCTNTKPTAYYIRDCNKSFPSGHTSLSVFLSIFLFCYLHKRACTLRPRMAGPTAQMAVVIWGIVCSFTRITDHRHHWWDVLGGGILGAVFSIYSVILCKNFTRRNPSLSRSVTSNGDSGRSLDNHNSVRRLISTSSGKHDDIDAGLKPGP